MKKMLSIFAAIIVTTTLMIPGSNAYADNGNNPYSGNRTVTGRYDLTSTGEQLNDAYETPIDKTDVTAINDPEQFCELMNQYCNPNEARNPGKAWQVDWSKPVVESGQSNIYYKAPGSSEDSRFITDCGWYQIVKTSKAEPWDVGQNQTFEVRVYGFENGYLLVNTTRNGIYFNERGEAVVNGAVVKHTNNCYYGDNKWHTTLAMKGELYWDGKSGPLTWEEQPIFYHTHYNISPYLNSGKENMSDSGQVFETGFGSCCDESLYK